MTYSVKQIHNGVVYVYEVYDGDRKVSVKPMSHDDAVTLCERLNRDEGRLLDPADQAETRNAAFGV